MGQTQSQSKIEQFLLLFLDSKLNVNLGILKSLLKNKYVKKYLKYVNIDAIFDQNL